MSNIDIQLFKTDKAPFDIDFDENGRLQMTQGLDTTIALSIFGERRADASEVSRPEKRRGWWGNELSSVAGFEMGSKMWVYQQSRLTAPILSAIKDAVLQSLQWMVDQALADRFEVEVTRNGFSGVDIRVDAFRSGNRVESLFFQAWNQTANAFNETVS